MNMIIENIHKITAEIYSTCQEQGRPLDSVKLLAVSKQQSAENIREAFNAGLREFGENYVQEALMKIAQLSDLNINWHYIGRIQANKTRAIAENFAWIHTVDREIIAQRLNDQRPSHLPPLQVCIQVNLGLESQKAGIEYQKLSELAHHISKLPNLQLRGLMTLPPANLENYAEQYAFFQRLRDCLVELLQKGFALDTLSMGMSHDFKAAIAAGATIIRIGSGIFGSRKSMPAAH